MSFMEETAAAEAAAARGERVCVMQSESIVNTNTFTYLTISRGDPFVIVNQLVGPTGRGRAWRRTCTNAISPST